MSQSPFLQDVLTRNQQAWNRMAESGHVLARPVREKDLENPLRTVDAAGWLTEGIAGWDVLCLAAGGGRHGPLYAAAGANVTVVDLSPAMLELDQQVSERLRLSVRTLQTSMDNLSSLGDATFDLVVHPVSTCYLPDLKSVFREVARVTRPGGLYISQHKQPSNLQCSLETGTGSYWVQHAYYDPGPVPKPRNPSKLREPDTHEFAHSWDAILGGICRSGFTIEDVVEPNHAASDAPVGSFHHRCHYIAPYIRLKARRSGTAVPKLVL